MSLNGTDNNFFFVNASETNWFYVFTPVNAGSREQAKMDGEHFIDFNNNNYNAARFTVAAEGGNDPAIVPEPASVALRGLGLVGVIASRRRKK